MMNKKNGTFQKLRDFFGKSSRINIIFTIIDHEYETPGYTFFPSTIAKEVGANHNLVREHFRYLRDMGVVKVNDMNGRIKIMKLNRNHEIVKPLLNFYKILRGDGKAE